MKSSDYHPLFRIPGAHIQIQMQVYSLPSWSHRGNPGLDLVFSSYKSKVPENNATIMAKFNRLHSQSHSLNQHFSIPMKFPWRNQRSAAAEGPGRHPWRFALPYAERHPMLAWEVDQGDAASKATYVVSI